MVKACTDKGNGIITFLQLIRNRTENANSIFDVDQKMKYATA